MPLLNLSPELIVMIAKSIEKQCDLYALNRTNKLLHALTTALLYRKNIHDHGSSALHWAAETGKAVTIVRMLKYGAPVDARDKQDRTPLLIAAGHGHSAAALVLITHNADLYATINTGGLRFAKVAFDWKFIGPPLVTAAVFNRTEIVNLLLDCGVDINYQEKKYRYSLRGRHETALTVAVSEPSNNSARLLLDRGADPELADDTDTMPLKAAVKARNLEGARILLEAGADVDPGKYFQGKPLQIAVENGCMDIAQLLLEWGANVNIRLGRRPKSVLKIAIRMERHEMAELLRAYGAQG